MLYFAYGSNMDWDQMRERCPSAQFVGKALLRDHKLAFTRKSVERGCGVADIVPEKGQKVWGVVYEISERDKGRLDMCEGFDPTRDQNAYWRRQVLVLLDGDEDKPLTAWTYFAQKEQDPPPPSAAYLSLLLKGARHWHLPEEYIRELELLSPQA